MLLPANHIKHKADDTRLTSVHSREVDGPCVTLSCNKTPGKSNLREKCFILAHSLRVQSFMVGVHNGRSLKKLFQMPPVRKQREINTDALTNFSC